MNSHVSQNISCVFLLYIFTSLISYAQISTDGSLGTPAQVLNGPDCTIGQELGKRAGNNLFHSFQDFNINTGESATFTGDADLQRVISRVTGGKPSNIDGLLKSEIPNADFYFTNPAGVLFGPNVSLDINGSFHVSTADYLKFGENDTFFSEPLKNEVLSTEAPTAYGFLDAEIGKITFQRSTINLNEGESLAVISGSIQAEGSTITIPQGEIDLICVASEGEVWLSTDDSGLTTFNLDPFTELGNISMTEGSIINVDGDGGGKVTFHGQDVNIDRSRIRAESSGSKDGHGINFNVSGSLDLKNFAQVNTATLGSGRAGNITIHSGHLNVVGGSLLLSGAVDIGAGGDLHISTDIMTIDGQGSSDLTGLLLATISEDSGGNGGNVTIETTTLEIINGGDISILTAGSGNGGNIAIDAETVVIDGMGQDTLISSLTRSQIEGGKAGDITITTTTLKILQGGNIDTGTLGSGDGGNISVTSTTIDIDGEDDSSIFTGLSSLTSLQDGGGKGGDITIDTNTLHVANGGVVQGGTGGSGDGGSININVEEAIEIVNDGLILKATTSSGNGGNLYISAETMVIDDQKDDNKRTTGIVADTTLDNRGGKAGNVTIETSSLNIVNGGTIRADTKGSGDGGNIHLTTNKIFIDGQGVSIETGISADSLQEKRGGKGGKINIHTDFLEIVNGGSISADTEGSGNGGNIHIIATDILIDNPDNLHLTGVSAETRSKNNAGKGGSITIDTQTLDIVNGGEITAGTDGSGDGGNLHITAQAILLDGRGSSGSTTITTQSELEDGGGKAGDVTIHTEVLGIVSNGFISAGTFGTGHGGNMNIVAEDIVIDQKDSPNFTGIIAETIFENGGGQGGDIHIRSTNLKILNKGQISTTGKDGIAGDITIATQEKLTLSHGMITTASEQSIGGDIKIHAPIMMMTVSSEIVAEAEGDGGNIIMDTDAIVMDGARISANAGQGNGGNITIETKGIFENHDKKNTITASSRLGIRGNITITGPDSDLTGSLFPLSEDFLEAESWTLSSCATKYSKGQIGSLTASPYPGDSLIIDDLLPSSSFLGNNEDSGDELMMDRSEVDEAFSMGFGLDCLCVDIGKIE